MVDTTQTPYPLTTRLLRWIAYILAGGTLIQALACAMMFFFIFDSQAAGMKADLLVQHLSYYFLGGTFMLLSVSNVLIKRGLFQLKTIRIPTLVFMLDIAFTNFLLIPRRDYLRETALHDGMPVMLSPFANYFLILNCLTLLLLMTQIYLSSLTAWRLSRLTSSQVGPN